MEKTEMIGQISLTEYIATVPQRCECGEVPTVRHIGCGIPNNFSPVTYDKIRYQVECSCGMESTSMTGWPDIEDTEKEAIEHWNNGWRRRF